MLSNTQINLIPVELIDSNPYQPRHTFDLETLEQLASSIKTHGLMQPISIRKKNNRYELIAGERRLRAFKLNKIEEIPALILDISDQDSALLALIENLQRKDLNFIEEAEGYYHLIHNHGLRQNEVAQKLGKNQSTIANKLRLLNLSRDIVSRILDNQLTERHARALLSVTDFSDQQAILDYVIQHQSGVKETENYIKDYLNPKNSKKIQPSQVKHSLKDIRIFTNTVKQAVALMEKSGVPVDYQITQNENCYEMTIKIPIIEER